MRITTGAKGVGGDLVGPREGVPTEDLTAPVRRPQVSFAEELAAAQVEREQLELAAYEANAEQEDVEGELLEILVSLRCHEGSA
jgi:hypothetical protein